MHMTGPGIDLGCEVCRPSLLSLDRTPDVGLLATWLGILGRLLNLDGNQGNKFLI